MDSPPPVLKNCPSNIAVTADKEKEVRGCIGMNRLRFIITGKPAHQSMESI